MRSWCCRWAGICGASALLLGVSSSSAATLVEVPSFGNNPSGAQMFIYVPDELAPAPPVLAAIHYCSGTAQAYFNGTGYKGLADQHGFIVVYPDAPSADGCWDVHSQESLSHDGGSDSAAIVAMVKHALSEHQGNPDRVYATGTSSGAMMTNVLLAAYPDVFKAGAAFAGVPHACFAGVGAWNSACATGQVSKTAQEWGDLVRAAYPGYAGSRPRMQLWHGTEDETLDFNNFGEAIKQWTNVLGVSEQPSTTETDTPKPGFTRTRYNDAGGVTRVEAIREQGVPHNIAVDAQAVVSFFGLDADADPGGGSGGGGSGGVGGASGGNAAGGNAGTGASGGGSGSGGVAGGDPPSTGAGSGGAGSAGTSFGTAGVAQAGNANAGAVPSPSRNDSASSDGGCAVAPHHASTRFTVLLLALAAIAARRLTKARAPMAD